MSELKFSVVIPLYNKGPHIGRAVRSVLAQTCPDFELIVIDDGSTDGGAEVVRGISDPRIILIRQENAGVSSARNRGIDSARAGLVAFLDADDEWKPTFLKTILRLRSKHPNAGLYAAAYEIVTPGGKMKLPKFREIPAHPWEGIIPSYFRTAALGDPSVCASAVCIPRKVFNDVGTFQVAKRMGEDLEMWGRIALRYKVAFTWHIGAVYYHNAFNRACSKFGIEDEHPFITTAAMVSKREVLADSMLNLETYVARLKLLNARQHVIAGNLDRARQLVSGPFPASFMAGKIMWGTYLNGLTRIMWKLKANILGYTSENYWVN